MRILVEDNKHPDRVTHPTGYAEIHRQLILALDGIGEDVYFPACEAQILATRLLPEDIKAQLLNLNRRRCPEDRDTVHLQIASPDSFERHPGRFDVGLTMTERESLAYYMRRFDWVGLCNSLDLILTPSEWNRDIFKRHGVRRVEVTPLGADCEFFTPKPVAFLAFMTGFGSRGSRANWQEIVDCFNEEFRGRRDVLLTILSHDCRSPFQYNSVGEAARMLLRDVVAYVRQKRRESYPEVIVREEKWDLTREAIREIYRENDCYISYSREGWGFPIVEAMACGLEVIACNYGGPTTYLAGGPAMLFEAGRLSDDNLKFERGDMIMLRRHMRSVYERRRRTREWIEHFSWRQAAEGISKILRERHSTWLMSQ
jgi:glycosyltransferase involved in cell wall biosynthesis